MVKIGFAEQACSQFLNETFPNDATWKYLIMPYNP